MREDKIPQNDQGSPSVGFKTKALRLVPNGEFEIVWLNDNPSQSVCIDNDLLPAVNKELIECLRANVDLFVISPDAMSNMDISVVSRQLNVDPFAWYVQGLFNANFISKVGYIEWLSNVVLVKNRENG